MLIKQLLNVNNKHRSFCYDRMSLDRKNHTLIIDVKPRKNGSPVCSICGTAGPVHDLLDERIVEYLPLWEFKTYFRYRMRRVSCPRCGKTVVEAVPWINGKSSISRQFASYLASWAKVMSWGDVAERFGVNWNAVHSAVQQIVNYGLEKRDISNIEAIGVDEVAWRTNHRYMTLVYQIDAGERRLIWVGENRTEETMDDFFIDVGLEMLRKAPEAVADPPDGGDGDNPIRLMDKEEREKLADEIEKAQKQRREARAEAEKVRSPEDEEQRKEAIAECRRTLDSRIQKLKEAAMPCPEGHSSSGSEAGKREDDAAASVSPDGRPSEKESAEECSPVTESVEVESDGNRPKGRRKGKRKDKRKDAPDKQTEEMPGGDVMKHMIRCFSKRIYVACSDMWHPYLKKIAQYLPTTFNVLDKFHISKKLNESMDTIRNAETRRLARAKEPAYLSGSRWCFLKHAENLTGKQALKMKELLSLNLKTMKAYLLKEQFQEVWDSPTADDALVFLQQWYHTANHCRIEEMQKISRMLQKHQELILNYFRTGKKYNSGIVEGLNRKVNLTIRKAYGFRSQNIAKLYLLHQLGKLPEPRYSPRFW